MKLPGPKSGISLGLPGFAGLPTLHSGRHSSPGLKAWGFLEGFINPIQSQLITFILLNAIYFSNKFLIFNGLFDDKY